MTALIQEDAKTKYATKIKPYEMVEVVVGEEEITIESTKLVYINSDANINFTADKKIMIAAEDKIKFKCKSSMIKMDGGIEVVGVGVKVN